MERILKSDKPFIAFFVGSPGSGKSHLTKYICYELAADRKIQYMLVITGAWYLLCLLITVWKQNSTFRCYVVLIVLVQNSSQHSVLCDGLRTLETLRYNVVGGSVVSVAIVAVVGDLDVLHIITIIHYVAIVCSTVIVTAFGLAALS